MYPDGIACLTNNNKRNHEFVGKGQRMLFDKVCRIIKTNKKSVTGVS